jgi:hypothetical protein
MTTLTRTVATLFFLVAIARIVLLPGNVLYVLEALAAVMVLRLVWHATRTR